MLWPAAGALTARHVLAVLGLDADERLTGLPPDGAPLHVGGGAPAPPAAGLLLAPLAEPAPGVRGAVWLAVTLGLLGALALLAARALPARHRPWAAPAALCLLLVALPVRGPATAVTAGLLALVLALAGWLLTTRRAPGGAPHAGTFPVLAAGTFPVLAGGALIGLAGALQPPLLLFAVLLLLTGRRRAAAVAGGAFAAATALAWTARAEESVTFWLRHLAGAGLGGSPDAQANQSLHGALLRLGASGPAEVAAFAVLAIVVCALALRRAARYAADGQRLLAAAVTGCAALAATPVAGQEQQLWLLLALAGRAGRRTADRPMWPVFAVLALTLEGTVLVPKIDALAVIGENIPLIAALLAACVVPFLSRGSRLWSRPVRAGLASRPNLLLELLLIRVGYWAYSWVRSYARGDRETAEEHGHQILDIQRFLRIDIEYAINQAVAARSWLSDAFDWHYQTFHFAVPIALLGWLLVRHPAEYRTARRWLALTTLFGLVGFWLYPLAPPRLMPGLGYIDTANGPQDLNDPRYGALTGITNPYAAMPSLHVGWSLWCALVLWRVAPHRWLRIAGFAYPLSTTVVIMGTANHYLLDAAGGAAVVAAGFAASAAVGRVLTRLPATAAAPPTAPTAPTADGPGPAAPPPDARERPRALSDTAGPPPRGNRRDGAETSPS
ncbi:hypothetical protein CAG99_11360 [Streptomyces marincola]|uniref:Inositolphosphotransferase Aur1/Ipt1 domain-containing protein n=1 Tax=Streptomyces marincola TaxID=2878388 RepID=A0A1W7D5U9_9ACTN|nr:hypothetical protein CAG99_11360 [Streptomyces marincola]